jgi:hypothetical protein
MVDQEFASAAYVPKPIRGCPAMLPAGWKGETGFDQAGRAKIFRSKKNKKKT